jgi:hypothetical protein
MKSIYTSGMNQYFTLKKNIVIIKNPFHNVCYDL